MKLTKHTRNKTDNAEMFYGNSIATSPASELPRESPGMVPFANLATGSSATTLDISFGSTPSASKYKIEWFKRSPATPHFGKREIQLITGPNSGTNTNWETFTLSMGDLVKALPGTVDVIAGYKNVTTSVDFTGSIARGDDIKIAGTTYVVDTDAAKTFDATHLPLTSAYTGATATAVQAFQRHTTGNVAWNALDSEVKKELQNLPTIGIVSVNRTTLGNGFQWNVTFDFDEGDLSMLKPNSNLLNAGGELTTVSEFQKGVLPVGYASHEVNQGTTSYTIPNLDNGVDYYVRVAAYNDRGYGTPRPCTPSFASPKGTPAAPALVALSVKDNDALNVHYEETAGAMGSPVEKYKIELASTSAFSGPSLQTVEHTPTHRVQKITTAVHTAPFDGGATFTLSFGDYKGDYTQQVGGATMFVSIANGGNTITKSSGASFITLVSPGDFVKVGTTIFRVSTAVAISSNALPLANVSDASQTVTHTGTSVSNLPCFKSDTTLGAMSVNQGESYLITQWSDGTNNDQSSGVARGDLIRVGDAETGEIFRVHTTRTMNAGLIPLASVDDPSIAASFAGASLGNKPFYKLQTTGALPFAATAVQVKSALEALTLVGTVDVTRAVNGNGHTWTVSFSSDRGASTLTPLRPNGFLTLTSAVSSTQSVTVVGANDVEFAGLTSGVQYFARVTAKNGLGFGAAGASTPTSLSPSFQVPQPPTQVSVSVHSNAELLVEFEAPRSNGGNAVSKYLIEWDTNNDFDSTGGMALGKTTIEASSASAIADVQRVTVSDSHTTPNLGGFFSLTHDGQTTELLAHDTSALAMKSALEALCTVTSVSVSRTIVANGFTWQLTFSDMLYGGNLLGKLTASGVALTGGSTNTASVAVESNLAARVGRHTFSHIIPGLSTTAYYIRVSAYSTSGYSTPQISAPESITPAVTIPSAPRTVAATVQSPTSIKVTWAAPQTTGGNVIDSYKLEWDVIDSFNSQCNATCSASTRNALGTVRGISALEYTITALQPGQRYFFRVRAFSRDSIAVGTHGYGPVAVASPSPIYPMGVPGVPMGALLAFDTTSSLRVEYAAPEGTKPEGTNGAPVTKYKVEYSKRINEAQTVTVRGTAAMPSSGEFKLRFMAPNAHSYDTQCLKFNASAAEVENALQALSVIDGVTVSRDPITYGFRHTVHFDGDYHVNGDVFKWVLGVWRLGWGRGGGRGGE